MRFTTFILKNLSRRPLRSLLTLCAIAIAIGSAVSLVGIAHGFEQTFLAMYRNAEVDMLVIRAGSRNRLHNTLDQDLAMKIKAVSGVKEVISGLVDVASFPDAGLVSVVLNGWEPESAVFNHLTVVAGRSLRKTDRRAVLLGTILAGNLGKEVGDTVEVVEKEPFEVVGIYESRNVLENGALVLPLTELQRIMDKGPSGDRPGQITGFSLILDGPRTEADMQQLRRTIEGLAPKLSALPTADFVKSLAEIRLAKAMSLITSCIALCIGLFGITNTMVMSVNERTREIGILRAVGWQVPRIVRMILLEAVFLGILGAAAGMAGAALLLQLLTRIPTINGIIDGRIQPVFYAYGLGVAVVLGLLASILPAIRATRMLPTEALRHE